MGVIGLVLGLHRGYKHTSYFSLTRQVGVQDGLTKRINQGLGFRGAQLRKHPLQPRPSVKAMGLGGLVVKVCGQLMA